MLSDFSKDFSEMLEIRYRKVEMCLLKCGYAKGCTDSLSCLRKSLSVELSKENAAMYERVRDEENALYGFLEEGAYKMGFVDGIEAAFLSLDKSRILGSLDNLNIERQYGGIEPG